MPKPSVSMWDDITVADVVSNLFVELTTFALVFLAGAMVGSFVNVVLYRMPRRINLLWPPSRCPVCGTRLGLRDNIPVLSYLALKGRCRHCGTPIPRSYLQVEARFGWLFLAVMYLVVHTGGRTLPLREPDHYFGALWTIWYPRPELLRVWVYVSMLAAVLGTFFLFVRRGERIPASLVVAAVAAGVAFPWYYAGAQQVPVGASDAVNAWRSAGPLEAAVGATAGLLLGLACAALAAAPRASDGAHAARLALPLWGAWPAVLGVVGCWLGWQAAVSVGVLSGGLALVFRRSPALHLLFAAVAVQLAGWRLLAEFAPWWPGPHTHPALFAAWVAVALLAGWARGWLPTPVIHEVPRSAEPPPAESPTPEPATPTADSAAGNGTNA